jgi:hypothetical protein
MKTFDLIGEIARLMLDGATLKEAADEMGVRPLAKGRRLIEARLAELSAK